MRYAIARGRDRGFALAAALMATVLISALLACFFFAVAEEARSGAAIETRDRALVAGESAIEAGLRVGRESPAGEHPVGATETRLADIDGFPTAVHLTRLDSSLFWLVAVVSDARNPGSQVLRIGVLARRSRSESDSITIVRITGQGWSELH